MTTREQLDGWLEEAREAAADSNATPWASRFEEAMRALKAAEARRPPIQEPTRVIVLSRPAVHRSTIKIGKLTLPIRFCVPCALYTTIQICPACGAPTLMSGRPPDRETSRRGSRSSTLKPEPGTVSGDGYIETEANEVKK